MEIHSALICLKIKILFIEKFMKIILLAYHIIRAAANIPKATEEKYRECTLIFPHCNL